jgi:hypothetical protein
MKNTRKMAQKHVANPCFDVFMRNSLFPRALIREIPYSHSLQMRAILINMSQKIAKLQANANAPNGCFQANIWPGIGTRKANISPDSAGLNETPHPGLKKMRGPDSAERRLAQDGIRFLIAQDRPLGVPVGGGLASREPGRPPK